MSNLSMGRYLGMSGNTIKEYSKNCDMIMVCKVLKSERKDKKDFIYRSKCTSGLTNDQKDKIWEKWNENQNSKQIIELRSKLYDFVVNH